MSLRQKIKYWFPTIVWALVIFSFSSKSSFATSVVHWQDFIVKKSAHLFVYAVLTVLVYRSLKHTTKLKGVYLFIFTITSIVLYAISDEFHQTFSIGREPTLRDVFIDTMGGLVGLLSFLKLYSRYSARDK